MANTKGEKELKTSYDELVVLDPTKYIGHEQNLVPEKSFVPARYKVGMD